tara:strand:+ start:60 stop:320 length:261 start_codon:yes stop_codon:yes gene_type:complete
VSTQQIEEQIQSLYKNEDIANKIANLQPATDMTDFSSSSGKSPSESPQAQDKLELEGEFLKRLMRDLSAHNQEFLDDSVFEIENYM